MSRNIDQDLCITCRSPTDNQSLMVTQLVVGQSGS